MLVKDFITNEVPVLKYCDTVEYVLNLMDELKVKQLPLVTGEGLYRGMVEDKSLLEVPLLTVPLADVSLLDVSIKGSASLHEALSLMARYGLSLLPVRSSGRHYVGVITQDRMVGCLADWCGVNRDGSVIVLELEAHDFNLTELSRLVESNNAHVLSLLTRMDPDSGRWWVALKIDLVDASPVLRSLERFNYNVRYHFMEQGVVDERLQRRMRELVHYMNI